MRTFIVLVIFAIFLESNAYTLYKVYNFDYYQQRTVINEHNRLRRLEGSSNMQEMVWDPNLAALAYAHSSTCNSWHSETATRVNSAGYKFIGENIWWSSQSRLPDLASVVRDLYNEKPYYNFASRYCQPWQQCGHYTAVVWATTCAVGCAAVYCDGIQYGNGINRGHVIICNYGPGGNDPQKYPFRKGYACSQCTAGTCNNGLCAPQCHGYRYESVPNSIQQKVQKPQSQLTQQLSVRPKGPASKICADYHMSCSAWAAEGRCSTHLSYMVLYCYRSCNTAACNSQVCNDLSTSCPYWASINECNKNPKWMNANCRKSCSRC